jgi:hypothetical protein
MYHYAHTFAWNPGATWGNGIAVISIAVLILLALGLMFNHFIF